MLRYGVQAQVGGKLAQIGSRLIDGTARKMADHFFDRFAAAVNPRERRRSAARRTRPDPLAIARLTGRGRRTKLGPRAERW